MKISGIKLSKFFCGRVRGGCWNSDAIKSSDGSNVDNDTSVSPRARSTWRVNAETALSSDIV